VLTLGVARRCINPSPQVPISGWGAQTHIVGTGIESDFWTTVLYLQDEYSISVIIDVDTSHFLIGQSDSINKRISKECELDISAIRLSSTHTHSGPMLWSQYYPNYTHAINEYNELLVSRTVEAVLEAKNNRVKVTVGAGNGMSHVAVNRRQLLESGRMVTGTNMGGLIDPTVGVVRFDDEMGQIVASIVHYSCHPTTLGFTNTLYSPDYPGVVKRTVEQIVGGTCLFLLGSAGNIGPGPEGFKADLPAMMRIGKLLGCEAAKVLLETKTVDVKISFDGVVESGAPLGMWKTEKVAPDTEISFKIMSSQIKLPLKAQLSIEEAQKIAFFNRDELARLQSLKAPAEQIKEFTYKCKRAFFALERSELYYGKSFEEIPVQFVKLGDIVLIGIPLEPFIETGIAIRERSPFTFTLFSGYANGWKGYLPMSEDYLLGGYEVDISPYAQGAAEILTEEIVRLLVEEVYAL
jgi:neutral ceramidase